LVSLAKARLTLKRVNLGGADNLLLKGAKKLRWPLEIGLSAGMAFLLFVAFGHS
jgi:hypothetical protein